MYTVESAYGRIDFVGTCPGDMNEKTAHSEWTPF
jgi:hypothetical protein